MHILYIYVVVAAEREREAELAGAQAALETAKTQIKKLSKDLDELSKDLEAKKTELEEGKKQVNDDKVQFEQAMLKAAEKIQMLETESEETSQRIKKRSSVIEGHLDVEKKLVAELRLQIQVLVSICLSESLSHSSFSVGWLWERICLLLKLVFASTSPRLHVRLYATHYPLSTNDRIRALILKPRTKP
jgi:small-conductance mechanosensitive channel